MKTTPAPVRSSQSGSNPAWADLFLGLLYAGSVALFLLWMSGQPLQNAPPALERLASSGWSWAVSAGSGALLTLVFYRRVSKWVVIWTVALTVLLVFGAYEVRIPRPLPSEIWQTTEGKTSEFGNQWEVKFDGSSFPCAPTREFGGTTLCHATGSGKVRAVERYEAGDKNTCTFMGTVDGSTVQGLYHCSNGGPYRWSARIVTAGK